MIYCILNTAVALSTYVCVHVCAFCSFDIVEVQTCASRQQWINELLYEATCN